MDMVLLHLQARRSSDLSRSTQTRCIVPPQRTQNCRPCGHLGIGRKDSLLTLAPRLSTFLFSKHFFEQSLISITITPVIRADLSSPAEMSAAMQSSRLYFGPLYAALFSQNPFLLNHLCWLIETSSAGTVCAIDRFNRRCE